MKWMCIAATGGLLIISQQSLGQDISTWSDKTICRLISSQTNSAAYADYVAEGMNRSLPCAINHGGGIKSADDEGLSPEKVMSKPNGVFYKSKLQQLWTAHKRIKSCEEFPSYKPRRELNIRLLRDDYFRDNDWHIPFNIVPVKASRYSPYSANKSAPEPVISVNANQAYGLSTASISDAKEWFSTILTDSLVRTDKVDETDFYRDDLKHVIIQWAAADALSEDIKQPWGDDTLEWEVDSILSTIIPSVIVVSELFTPEERVTVGKWLNRLVRQMGQGKHQHRYANHSYMEANMVILWGLMVGDDDAVLKAIDEYKKAIHDMRPDGSFPQDTVRGGMGLNYQFFSTAYLVNIAALVHYNLGIDLHAYSVDGRSIKNAVEFVAMGVKNPVATNLIYAQDCPGGGDFFGTKDNPNMKIFMEQLPHLAVYADLNPDFVGREVVEQYRQYLPEPSVNLGVYGTSLYRK